MNINDYQAQQRVEFVQAMNPNRDERGRFASGAGGQTVGNAIKSAQRVNSERTRKLRVAYDKKKAAAVRKFRAQSKRENAAYDAYLKGK